MKAFKIFAIFATLASPLSAAVIVSGNVSTFNAPCTFAITTDINVSIIANAPDGTVVMAFDNWVAADPDRTDLTLSPNFSYRLNGADSTVFASLSDNLKVTLGSLTPTDGFIYFYLTQPLVAGDIFTIQAGSYNFTGVDGFNTRTVGTFTGNLIVTDSFGNSLASPTAVPEPSASVLGLVGAAMLFRRRRRRIFFQRVRVSVVDDRQ